MKARPSHQRRLRRSAQKPWSCGCRTPSSLHIPHVLRDLPAEARPKFSKMMAEVRRYSPAVERCLFELNIALTSLQLGRDVQALDKWFRRARPRIFEFLGKHLEETRAAIERNPGAYGIPQ